MQDRACASSGWFGTRSPSRWWPGPAAPTTSSPRARRGPSGRRGPCGEAASRRRVRSWHGSWATRRERQRAGGMRWPRAGSGHLQRRSSDVSAGAGSRAQVSSCSGTKEGHWRGSWPSRAGRSGRERSSIGQDARAGWRGAHGIQLVEHASGGCRRSDVAEAACVSRQCLRRHCRRSVHPQTKTDDPGLEPRLRPSGPITWLAHTLHRPARPLASLRPDGLMASTWLLCTCLVISRCVQQHSSPAPAEHSSPHRRGLELVCT